MKCFCILTVIRFNDEPTLCILGDAIASFLKTSDPTTKKLGIVTQAQIIKFGEKWVMKKSGTIPWKSRPVRWHHAVSFRRWAFLIVMLVFLNLTMVKILNLQVLHCTFYSLGEYHVRAYRSAYISSKHQSQESVGHGLWKAER